MTKEKDHVIKHKIGFRESMKKLYRIKSTGQKIIVWWDLDKSIYGWCWKDLKEDKAGSVSLGFLAQDCDYLGDWDGKGETKE